MKTNDILSYFNFAYNTYQLFHVNLLFHDMVEYNIVHETLSTNDYSTRIMQKIQKIHVCKSLEKECYICLDSVKENPTMRQFACTHTFHPKCISQWIRMKRTEKCPVCRQDLFDTHC